MGDAAQVLEFVERRFLAMGGVGVVWDVFLQSGARGQQRRVARGFVGESGQR